MRGKIIEGELFDDVLELSDVSSVFRVISRTEYIILGKIIKMTDEEEGITKVYLEDLKKELKVPMPAVSELVRNMSDDGYLRWELDPLTKKTYVELTSNGVYKYNLQKDGMRKMSMRIDEEMTPEEKEIIIRVLKRFDSILEEERGQTEHYFKLISGTSDSDLNVMSLLKPKSTVTYINGNDTLEKTMNILRENGYATVPVVGKDGRYLGTISEGDLLWYITDHGFDSVKDTYASEVTNTDRNPAVHDIVDSKTIVHDILSQNFLCMVDDRECFIGIITRKDIIRCLKQKIEKK